MTRVQKIANNLKKRYKYEVEFLGVKPRNKTHRLDSLNDNFLKKIDLNRFYKGNNNDSFIILGDGTYANTYLVYEVGTEKEIAAKVFKQKLNDSMINSFKREIIMASQFKNHPAIVQYIGFNEHSLTDFYKNRQLDEMKPTLFMSYISGGNLEEAIIKARSLVEKENELNEIKNELIEKLNKEEDKELIQKEIDKIELEIKEIRNDKGYFNNTKKLKIIIGIASGLSEMFKFQIIHRDLKPENILLTENFEPVICDLGSSRQYSDEREQMSRMVGTPIYMAPELYNDEFAPAYRFEVDSYSYAIILYQLLELKLDNDIYPKDSSNSSKLMKYKFDNYLPDLPDDLNEVLRDIILLCWNISLDQRLDPTAMFINKYKKIYFKIISKYLKLINFCFWK